MAQKYVVKPESKDSVVYASKYEGRTSGEYVLAECSQKELKYLHDVVGFKGIEIVESDVKGKGTTGEG